MKTGILFVSVLLALSAVTPLQAQQLGDLRWQYRILLLMNPKGDPLCDQQLQALKTHRVAMQERDVLLFVFDGRVLRDENGRESAIGAAEIPNPGYQGVILLGKDGGIKLRKPFPVAPEEIFRRIDAMPMRKAEKQDNKK